MTPNAVLALGVSLCMNGRLGNIPRHKRQAAENPELLVLRARRLYERRGYSRRWVDKRLHGVSARHELTGEWHRRGATESDSFRAPTNRLMQSAFGMDAEMYRRYKNLTGANQNLRDHISDLELAQTRQQIEHRSAGRSRSRGITSRRRGRLARLVRGRNLRKRQKICTIGFCRLGCGRSRKRD